MYCLSLSSLNQSSFTISWKKAIISQNKNILRTLTIIIPKNFETIISSKLRPFPKRERLLSDYQQGFLSRHFIGNLLGTVSQSWLNLLDKWGETHLVAGHLQGSRTTMTWNCVHSGSIQLMFPQQVDHLCPRRCSVLAFLSECWCIPKSHTCFHPFSSIY